MRRFAVGRETHNHAKRNILQYHYTEQYWRGKNYNDFDHDIAATTPYLNLND